MAQVENHNNFGTFKIEMVPEFNGKCDVANFIRDVNHIFDIHKPCEQFKVISLQNYLLGSLTLGTVANTLIIPLNLGT